MVPPLLIGLALALALVVLLPARRLQLAGLDSRWIGGYAATLWIVAMLLVLAPSALRFLFPILLVAWVAPFIVAPERMARVFRGREPRGPRGPGGTVRNVTPPSASDPPSSPARR